MSRPRPPAASSGKPSIRFIAILIGVALVLFGFQYLVGPWWALGVIGGLLLVVAVLVLMVAKTSIGKRLAGAVWVKVGRTRIGRRLARWQLEAEAKRRGVNLVDAAGRPLSDIEIQLEVLDTPEARAIKRQLKAMNPRQRAQALRAMQAQAEEAQRTGVAPTPMKPPRQKYGRPR